MRLIKMFGLAAIAAAAVMAFVGVTSAMAVTELEKVVLCDQMVAGNNASVCPEGHDFPSGTVIHGELLSGTNAVLLGGIFGDITCTESAVLATTDSLLVHGEITAFSFPAAKCTHFGEKCTEIKSENLPYLFKGELNAAHTGYEQVSKGIAATPKVHVVCPGVNCTFSSASTLFNEELNETDAVLSVLQEVANSGGGFCPSTSIWHAKYLTRCLNSTAEFKPCWMRMEA